MTALFGRRYGSTPLHLLTHLALIAVFAYVALQLSDARAIGNIIIWFVAAIMLHDLLLLPFYTTLDRVAKRAVPRGAVNYVRVPIAVSLLLLLLFYPPILGRNDGSFARVAGVEPAGYLERWLLVSAVLFVLAGVLYVLQLRRRRA